MFNLHYDFIIFRQAESVFEKSMTGIKCRHKLIFYLPASKQAGQRQQNRKDSTQADVDQQHLEPERKEVQLGAKLMGPWAGGNAAKRIKSRENGIFPHTHMNTK